MPCNCRCHAYGAGAMVSCDAGPVQPGGARSCQADAQLHAAPVAGSGAAGPVAGAAEPAADGPQIDAEPPIPPEEACVLPHGDEPRRRHVGLLCGRHYGELEGRLREIETLFALRDELLLPGPGGERVSGGGFGSPAPGRIELMQVTDARSLPGTGQVDVPGVLASWARLVVEERGVAEVVGGTVTQSVRILRVHRKWIAAQDWVDDYAGELRDVHRALATASWASMWAESIGACINCGANLYADVGVDAITCRKCKSTWAGVHYLRLRLILDQQRRRSGE